MDKQNYRDAIKCKNYFQGLSDDLYGHGEGYVDSFYDEKKDITYLIFVQPQWATRQPQSDKLPIRYVLYNSKGRCFRGVKFEPISDEDRSAIAKRHLKLFQDEHDKNPKCESFRPY